MPLTLHSAFGLITASVLVLVPGWSILRLAGARFADPAVAIGMALGIGVAIQPLLWLWMDTLGVPVTPWSLIGALSLMVVLGTVVDRRRRRRFDALRRIPIVGSPWPVDTIRGEGGDREDAGDGRDGGGEGLGPRGDAWAAAALTAVALASFAARWWAARDLDLPRWGDSVHHTVIVTLLMDNGGFPADWRPYADLASFSYHFGFHALAAGVAELARLAPHQAVILGGQALMVFGVLTVYAFGTALGGRPWVGVGAALAAAGLSTMPAYYLNWGRYTQLAGQVILPVAAACIVMAAPRFRRGADPGRPSWRALVGLAAVAVAGLALTHYIVVLFLVLFGVAWLAVGAHAPDGVRGRAAAVATLGAAGLGGALLAAPWTPHFLEGPIAGYAASLSTAPPPDPGVWGIGVDDAVWSQLGQLAGWGLVAAFAMGIVIALIRRDRAGLVSGLWVLLLVSSTHRALLGLPVTGLLKPFTVAIALYVAAGPAVGAALAFVAGGGQGARAGWAAASRARRWRSALVASVVAAAAVVAAFAQRDVLIEQTRLVGPADRAALDWIRENVTPSPELVTANASVGADPIVVGVDPARAQAAPVFLVSAFAAFGDTVAAGDDAGWWLPYLTGLSSTLPPISYGMERPLESGYRERVNELVRLWHDDLAAPDTVAALDRAGVTHAFVGEMARRNDAAGTGQGLAGRLGSSPEWRLIHENRGVQVWERTGVAPPSESR